MNKENKNMPKPDVSLNSMDKFYLAVARQPKEKLTMIYMLFCPRVDATHFALKTETEIATFNNAAQADVFYQTVLAMQQYQHSFNGGRQMAEIFADEIGKFHERVR